MFMCLENAAPPQARIAAEVTLDRGIARSGLAFEHAQHRRLPRPLEMIDNVVDARREAIGVDLHRRKLRAQGRQALAEALPEMLEAGGFEMRHCSGHCGATEPERHRRCPQIEQRQHHLQHGLKAGAVVGELELRRYLAVLQRHRRGGVGTQPQTVPGARDR